MNLLFSGSRRDTDEFEKVKNIDKVKQIEEVVIVPQAVEEEPQEEVKATRRRKSNK